MSDNEKLTALVQDALRRAGAIGDLDQIRQYAEEVVGSLLETDGERIGWMLCGDQELVFLLAHIRNKGDYWIVEAPEGYWEEEDGG